MKPVSSLAFVVTYIDDLGERIRASLPASSPAEAWDKAKAISGEQILLYTSTRLESVTD